MIMATEPKAFSYFSSEIHLPDSSRPGEQREGVFLYIQSLPYQLKNKVTVLYTSYELTREAMKTACTLALRLDAVIEIVAAEVVPYPMPLDRPPVPFRSFIRCFESTLNQYPVKTELRVFLCRDQLEFLKQVLRPDSPVIMGVKATWPTQDEKLVQSLRRAGYEVILAKRQ